MEDRTLHILWTNADPNTANHMVMMYATNAVLNHWWDRVVVIIWGATAKYAATDATIQERIKMAQHAGVEFSACIACAINLGVTQKLQEMGMEVKAWGQPLTEIMQERRHLLTI